jgi:hypothetical protein
VTRHDLDVAVVGAGSAGLAAAVTAARLGARTLLIERSGMLGGMATTALVHTVCGLYLLRSQPGAELANPGFPAELAGRLLAAGAARPPVRIGRVDVLPHHPTGFATVADGLVRATSDLTLRLHTEVIAAGRSSTGWTLELSCRGGSEAVEASALVDASGDATCLARLGAEVEQAPADVLQRPAYVCALGGLGDGALEENARLRIVHGIATAVRAGELPRAALGAMLRSSGRTGEAFLTIDLDGPTGRAYDPLDVACLTALEIDGRAIAEQIVAHLGRRQPGFERSHVAAWPSRLGVRESRRACGEYRLEGSDLLSGASFPDAIALATWPMELRERAAAMRLRFPESDRPCEIPLRALRVRALDGVFVAGRCLSASHEAQASIRVIGTCLATGEAAGIAAALYARDRTVPTAADVNAARTRSLLSYSEAARAIG